MVDEGRGRTTSILKYHNYSENYNKKTDEYFSIILFAMGRLYSKNFAKHGYLPRGVTGPRPFFGNIFCGMNVD